MKNLHNAASDLLEDLDIAEVMDARVDDDRTLTLMYRQDPNRYVKMRVRYRGNHVGGVVVLEQNDVRLEYQEILIESLIGILEPDYWD